MKQKIGIILHNELFGGVIIVMIFLLLLLTSCASTDDRTQALLLKQTAPTAPTKTDTLNSELIQRMASEKKSNSAADYRVGPEDLLDIDVFQVPELKTTARVSARGYIRLHLIDEIRADGLTVSELESLIATRLGKYLQEPVVAIFVKEYRSQQISVLGAVKNPQVYYVSGQRYLLDILSLSGGLTPEAGSVCILQTISTASPGNSSTEKIVIDLDELLINGRAELNVPVKSGDVIQVPKKGVVFVTGAVMNPGEIQLGSKTTLTEAIGMAKGLRFEASRSDIKIYRDSGKSQREVIMVDYDSVLAGATPDSALRDKDIVIVSENGLKSFIKGIAGTLNFGLFSLGKGAGL